MKTNLLPLAKEGISYFFASLTLLVILLLLDFGFLSFILFMITLFIAYSFRNPERELVSYETTSLLSPVDGVVESIVELENSEYAYKIEIQSSYSDVGVLRAPANACIDKLVRQNGTRVSKSSKLFETLNENTEISFLTQEKNKFKVSHRLQRSFSPLSINLKEEQKLIQTQRYGLMLNGTTTIYLPHNFRVNITIGSDLIASESLIGYFS